MDSGNQIGFGTSFISSVNSRYAGAAFGSRDGAGNYSFYGLMAEGQSNQQNLFPAGRNRWGDYFWGNEDVCPSPLGYWEEIESAGPGNAKAQNGTWNTIIGNLFSSSPPSNDSCAGGSSLAFPTVGLSQDVTFATYSELDPLDPATKTLKNGESVWYSFNSPGAGTVEIDTLESNLRHRTVGLPRGQFFALVSPMSLQTTTAVEACNPRSSFKRPLGPSTT